MPEHPSPLIILVAGEASGDQLGGALMRELKALVPGAHFAGIGAGRMRSEGLDCWWDSEELAVMGLAEVLSHLPRLLRLRKALTRRILASRPALFIGIDSPDFNLGLERRLRQQGIPAIHYVSPTVWAWRQGRVRNIAASADQVLCLFPFEKAFYDTHGVDARYTGHPLADEIEEQPQPAAARSLLGLDPERTCIGILPGSRHGEVQRLSRHLLGAAQILKQEQPALQFLAPMASPGIRRRFEAIAAGYPGLDLNLLDGRARDAIAASDLVLCASGTVTLETMLINRPMVAIYRFSHLTYAIGKSLRLMKSPFWSLPNILAGERLVPELEQYQANAQRIAQEARAWLVDPQRVAALQARFSGLHHQLRMNAARRAAEAVAGRLEQATAR